MKPEFESRRIFGITRAKGKMYELALPEVSHLAVPAGTEPESLFLLTVGNLGDVAALVNERGGPPDAPFPPNVAEEIDFSASFFDAYLSSRFSSEVAQEVMLLAASAYYLARRPGSSLVLARRLSREDGISAAGRLLRWSLQAKWGQFPILTDAVFGDDLSEVAKLLAFHFYDGSNGSELPTLLASLRHRAYEAASPKDLLLVDLVSAIVRMRLAVSAWNTLPEFTQLPIEQWAAVIQRPGFPKELWPSQVLLGRAGMFSGNSGVVQMPTSAGKTRSVEIVLRSGFLSGRARLAVIVAPFRALCHEIGTTLRNAFKGEDVKVNELSDALQLDFLDQIAELLGSATPTTRYVLVLTPEKLLYVSRQAPALVRSIGLVVYDEGHQFDSGSRGITYELLLTELKELLPISAQTVLVSAVIRNASAVGKWLVGERATVVDGTGLLSTARSIAFTTWIERLGQLQFFESGNYDKYEYFVPRAIEQQTLTRRPGERTDRHFPKKGDDAWKDVSLYLGIRLAPQGAVAIFCGRKDTATALAERAVEVYTRGYAIAPPSAVSDREEIKRLVHLIRAHFGATSSLARAAELGVFVHHGTTPHGLRLSIEHAMQHERIKLIACTSTLAQGVNLPIRYLIVSGINQGADRIGTRDFQNLIGRAGRAGMHTEGLVIFADPRVLDARKRESWRFEAAIGLLDPNQSEETTSTLLTLLAPFTSPSGRHSLPISLDQIPALLLSAEDSWAQWAVEVEQVFGRQGFTASAVLAELKKRRRLLTALESYLMVNRGHLAFAEFKAHASVLASHTLAYHLASAEQKAGLVSLFELVAEHVERAAPEPTKQLVYSKTLLGVDNAKVVEAWVLQSKVHLSTLEDNDAWLDAVWPLLVALVEDKFFTSIEPPGFTQELARGWLHGRTYGELIAFANAQSATKPWGSQPRRRLTEADVVDFLEGALGFDCSLILAAVTQFWSSGDAPDGEPPASLTMFQKALKYGLPDALSISCVERGFADRVVAQQLRDSLALAGYAEEYFGSALVSHRASIAVVLANYPKYFEDVLNSL